MVITSLPVLQGEGRVLFRNGEPVANILKCIGPDWSVRVVGGRFPMSSAECFMTGRKYGIITSATTEEEAISIALGVLRRQRKHRTLDAIWQTGVRDCVPPTVH